MSTLAVARLRNVNMGPAIIEYLERIDATLEPYGGRFLVHGGKFEQLEGNWSGDLIIIEFADRETARAWYNSPSYQAIVPLRMSNSEGDIIFIDTVAADHRATDVLGARGA
jgi:uncharacterized protein (DUF1330 family)